MKRLSRLGLAVVAGSALAACSIFEDPTPETVAIRMTGSNGTQVMAIYAQEFTAGVNEETSTTEVRIGSSDTVMAALPIDTIVDIVESRQLFLQVEALADDTADVGVTVDLDTRNLVNESGLIFPGEPWRFVYQFNRPLTSVVEVVF